MRLLRLAASIPPDRPSPSLEHLDSGAEISIAYITYRCRDLRWRWRLGRRVQPEIMIMMCQFLYNCELKKTHNISERVFGRTGRLSEDVDSDAVGSCVIHMVHRTGPDFRFQVSGLVCSVVA